MTVPQHEETMVWLSTQAFSQHKHTLKWQTITAFKRQYDLNLLTLLSDYRTSLKEVGAGGGGLHQ